MKEYTKPYTTPYYDGLKDHGIRLPAVLQLIRTDKARIEKPTDATMWRNMFLTCAPMDARTHLIHLQ